MTEILELRDMLINSSIDFCAVQKSKLHKRHKTPIMEGFATICKDRKEFNGGSLLLFNCNNLTREELNSAEKVGL